MATMKDKKEKGYGLGRSQEAIIERTKQLKQWDNSETNREQETIKNTRQKPRVKFSDGVIFLAATAAGDINEVEHLILEDGIDVNYKNLDGMTALHQCCIDDNLEMAMVLVKNSADIDAQDKEGWTPLHAASSCGHAHIVQYLLNNGAHPALVNSDGDTPFDIAEDEEVQDLLQSAIDSQGIDVDNQKQREETVLLNDAMKLKNNPDYKPIVSAGGATLLHIACSKGYESIIKVLLSCSSVKVDAIDDDGWTPLHAAIYWSQIDAAEQLVEHGANVDAVTSNGDVIDDLVDPELAEKLDELRMLSETCQKDKKIVTSHHVRSSSYSGTADGLKHNSPSLKRRHSKDRAEYPKLVDMLREKKELQTMREQEQDEQTTSPPLEASVAKEQSPATTTSAATQPHKEQIVDSQLQQTTQHREQSIVEDTNKVQQQPLQSTQSLPPGGNHNNPEKFEKRASVSERRKMFEPQFGGGGLQDKKIAIRAREKTPGHPAGQDKDKNAPQQSSTPLSHKQGDPNPPKRFSFVPKHVAPYDDARLQADTETKSVVPKRSSSDGRTNTTTIATKNLTNKSLFFSSSANEIREPKHLNDTKTSTDYHEHNKQQQQQKNSPVDAKATTPPFVKKPQRTSSAQNFQVAVPPPPQQQHVNHDESLHESVSSSISGGNNTSVVSSTSESVSSGFTTPDTSLLSDRSNSITGFSRLHSEEAEAKRRVTAKKKREARRVTQPVDNELLKLISKEDAEHEQREDELQAEAEQLADKLKPNSPDASVETTNESTITDQPSQVGADQQPPTGKPVQSRFKPAARPAPRFTANNLPQQQTLWIRSDGDDGGGSGGDIPVEVSLTSSVPASVGSSSFSSPKPKENDPNTPGTPGGDRNRTLSDVRRRPKSSRRSTGITYEGDKAEENKEDLSDELCKLISSANSRKLPQTPDQTTHNDVTSRLEPSADPPPPPPSKNIESENAELRRLLAEERSKKDKIYDDFYHSAVKIDELKKNNAELTRRSEDTSRAYDQEKKEKERLQSRLKELEDMLKCFQDISSENQRLKDENGALIRVIGKLSRSPLQQH